MAIDIKKQKTLSEVPKKIFSEFLNELQKAEISEDITARLRIAILDDESFSEKTIKKALLNE
ncbi:MAG: hypothetical protein WC219_06485 [Acholeplasmataceae bacterium]